MSSSRINPTKKPRGRPPVDSEQLNLRLQRDLLDGIDAYSATLDDKPVRPETVRRIIRDWLVGHGFLPAPPEDLN